MASMPFYVRAEWVMRRRFERPGKGDHEIWYSPLTNVRFPVDHKIKSRHTANGVLKQAGLPKAY